MPDNTFIIIAIGIIAFLTLKFLIARPGISASEAARLARAGEAVIIDVREPPEWTSGVAKPAKLLPLSDLRGSRDRWRKVLREHKDRKLLVYCHSGMRSSQAAALLRREGFEAVNLGSFARWQRAGLPTRKP